MSCAAALAAVSVAAAQVPAARPTDAQVDRFVSDLLAKMTPDEKIGQMEQAAGQPFYTPPAKADELTKSGGVGSFLFTTDPVRINQLQKIAVEGSRLHIPLLFGYDVIHGFRTIYPIPLAMASSWDPALAEKGQSMAAREARSAGVHWAFAPMVDIARDARWGRIMESAGEDPVLGEAMAAAQVRGFQGAYVGEPGHLIASVKHYAGYGAAEGGRDYDSVSISDDLLYNVYLRPYHAGVKAGTATMMSAYMDLNSVPATGNKFLMQDVLRKEWGFKGWVVSDWEAVKNLQTHGFAASPADAAARAANAGINMEMTSSTYRDTLKQSLASGAVSTATIDALVRPILETKYRLGLFTNPYVDLSAYKAEQVSAAQREASRRAAEQTAVLLRNEGGALPLAKGLKSVAVIGPLADSKLDILGGWSIHADRADSVTVFEGLREKLAGAQVVTTPGVEIERGSPTIFDEQVVPDKPKFTTAEAKAGEFSHALELAKAADTVVMVLGEAQTMNSENASRASITLPGEQERLLEAVVATGKPVVLVVMTGRPVNLNWANEHVPAILNIWYPGTEGGHAVANLLVGEANPSGHLPLTWPRDAGQEPLYYNQNIPQNPDNVAHRYWDMPSTPLYPFGYGLSYSKFTVGAPVVGGPVSASGTLTVSVAVTNTSGVAGATVVQMYTHQRAGSASRPRRELKEFSKVMVGAGETKTVSLAMPAKDLTYWSAASKTWVLEPGTFDVWVGLDSEAEQHSTFTLTR